MLLQCWTSEAQEGNGGSSRGRRFCRAQGCELLRFLLLLLPLHLLVLSLLILMSLLILPFLLLLLLLMFLFVYGLSLNMLEVATAYLSDIRRALSPVCCRLSPLFLLSPIYRLQTSFCHMPHLLSRVSCFLFLLGIPTRFAEVELPNSPWYCGGLAGHGITMGFRIL